jgi:hypothetical protein
MKFIALLLISLVLGCGCATTKHSDDSEISAILNSMTKHDDGLPAKGDTTPTEWTESVTAFYRDTDGGWSAKKIRVAALPGEHCTVCYHFTNQRLVDCFYLFDSGMVDFESMLVIGEETT